MVPRHPWPVSGLECTLALGLGRPVLFAAWLYSSLETAHINTTAGWAGPGNQLVSLICIQGAPDTGAGQEGEGGRPRPGCNARSSAAWARTRDPHGRLPNLIHHHVFSHPLFIVHASISEYKFLALKLQLLGCTRRSSG